MKHNPRPIKLSLSKDSIIFYIKQLLNNAANALMELDYSPDEPIKVLFPSPTSKILLSETLAIIKDVRGKEKDLHVLLVARRFPPNGDRLLGSFSRETNEIALFLDASLTLNDVLDSFSIIQNRLVATLEHELVHAHDVLSKKEYPSAKRAKEDYSSYINSVEEFKAFSYEILEESLLLRKNQGFARKYHFDKADVEAGMGPYYPRTSELVDLVLHNSKTYRMLSRYLDEKNKKKLYQLVAQAIEEYIAWWLETHNKEWIKGVKW